MNDAFVFWCQRGYKIQIWLDCLKLTQSINGLLFCKFLTHLALWQKRQKNNENETSIVGNFAVLI